MRSLRTFAAFIAILVGATLVSAGTPKLARVTPPGGQRGTTVEVFLTGKHLDSPRDVVFYEPGIKAVKVEAVDMAPNPNGKSTPVEPGTRVRLELQIAPDCPLGAHGLRLYTAGGLSEYHRFFVGPFPIVEEDEVITKQRNDKRENAKAVPANVTVHGRLNDPSDVDTYAIEVKKGQRVSAEVEAFRIGVERGIADMFLTIYDPDGKKLAAADDSALYIQDPVLSVVTEKDGPHYVEIRHCMFAGTGDPYRLHIGTFSRPTGIYPSGGQAGTALKVRMLGDPKGAWEQVVQLPKEPGDFPFVAVDPAEKVGAPSPNRLRVSPFPNVLEVEPNNLPGEAPPEAANLPAAFNGIIDKPGDVDCFRFRAKKGEQFQIHALAQGLGSPVDPIVWIRQVGGKSNAQLVRIADSRLNQLGMGPAAGLNRETHDPMFEWTVPADGEYVLGVEDERGEGSPEHVYRVEVRPVEHAVYTYIVPEPENQNAPQLRQTINIGPGNRTTAQVGIFANTRPYAGELELAALNLPKGVTMTAPKLLPGMTKVPVVFEAAKDAAPQAALIDVVARPVAGKEALASGYRQTIMMNNYGNNDYYLHVPVGKLAVSVTDPAPFRVLVEEPKSSLVQNGEMVLKFKVERAADFDGPVTVQMDYKPTGISTATPAVIQPNQNEGQYIIGAARNAAAGVHQLTLTAVSGVGRRGRADQTDRSYVASQPFVLTIAEPHVEGKLPRASIERNKTATMTVKVNHLQPFEGKAQATLSRLPRGIELVEPMKEITSADKEVAFTLKATGEALVGNYQGIVLDVTVMANGQPVRQLSGSGMLRIDAERGVQPKK